MISGLKGSTYEEKCEELGLKILEERRGGQDMALVHKFLTKQTGTDLFKGQEHDKQQGNMAYQCNSQGRIPESTRLLSGLLTTGTDCQRK
jgi:hypothetical protein